MSSAPLISKTSFLAGCQCQKLLWKKLHEPDAFPPVDAAKQAIFDQGHTVGDLAKALYPGGLEVGEGVIRSDPVLAETASLIPRRVPLYEPAFTFDGGFARIDLLVPDGDEAWRIVEVKSGTRIKDENVLDVAFQLHLCRGAGLQITRCALMHVDNTYVRNGKIDPAGLLVEHDITADAEALLPGIPEKLAELHALGGDRPCPSVPIGPHCTKPYSCDLKPQCWAYLPDYPVTDFAGDGGGKRWQFLTDGIRALADIPDPSLLSTKQQIQVETARSGEPHLDRPAIRAFLKKLRWPLAYFDIETTSSAIPHYDGTKPYQQVPFQFSLHVQEEEGGPQEKIAHHEFLAAGTDDPRPAFLTALQTALPPDGTVIAYNASFENTALRACATAFPDHDWAANVPGRTLDLLVPFRNFSYHHPDQHGSASIKNVLPVLASRNAGPGSGRANYSHLAIQDGNAAARAFATAEFGNLPAEDRAQIRTDLLAYCKLDTQAMVDPVEALRELVDR